MLAILFLTAYLLLSYRLHLTCTVIPRPSSSSSFPPELQVKRLVDTRCSHTIQSSVVSSRNMII